MAIDIPEGEHQTVYWDPVKRFWHDPNDNWYSIHEDGTVLPINLPVHHTDQSAMYMTEAALASSPDYFRRTISGNKVVL